MKAFKDIIDEYQGRRPPYSILLSLEEWKRKRQEIIKRENNTCEQCGAYCIQDYIRELYGLDVNLPAIWVETEQEVNITDPFTGEVIDSLTKKTFVLTPQSNPQFPQVHHTYYVVDRLPWDYPNESLMLVCHKCHSKIHEEELIKVYDNDKLSNYNELTPCYRCNASGYLYEFNYHKNGICFGCNGQRFKEWM